MRLTTYVNAVDPVAQVYDGFFVHARGRSGSPLDESGPMRDPSAPPERFRDDLRVPVLCFQAETDLIGPRLLPRAPARQRHVPAVGGRGHGARRRVHLRGRVHRQRGASDRRARGRCGRPPRRRSGFELRAALSTPDHSTTSLQAALVHFDRWLRDGTPPPIAPAPRGARRRPDTFVVDEHGNARGGIRTPHVDVPIAILSGLGNDGGSISRICGTTDPVRRGEARVALLEQGRLLRQVRRRDRRRRRRRLLPRSRRPRDQSHRRRALPGRVANRRHQTGA